jgi:hypothetical protein
MSVRRGGTSGRSPRVPVTGQRSAGRWLILFLAVIVVVAAGVIAAEHTSHGRSIVTSVHAFLLTYMGVFALIGLTTSVGVGLVATDRIVMKPGQRIVAQAVHRGVSLAALTALIAHILLEITAHKVGLIDAVVPFMARFRTLYTGFGTIAFDLVILIVLTGYLRGRFAGRWPWTWRAIHALTYLAWPLSIIHGLLGGRTAHPYVDWSYGACVALVILALGVRFAATVRADEEKVAHPVSDRLSSPADGVIPGSRVTMAPVAGQDGMGLRALPAGSGLTAGTGPSAEYPWLSGPGMGGPEMRGAGPAYEAGTGQARVTSYETDQPYGEPVYDPSPYDAQPYGQPAYGHPSAPDWAAPPQPRAPYGRAARAGRDSGGWTMPDDNTSPRGWVAPAELSEPEDWADDPAATGGWNAPGEWTPPGEWAPSHDGAQQ